MDGYEVVTGVAEGRGGGEGGLGWDSKDDE